MQVHPAQEHMLKEYRPVPEMGFGDMVAGQMAKSHKRLHPHKHTHTCNMVGKGTLESMSEYEGGKTTH